MLPHFPSPLHAPEPRVVELTGEELTLLHASVQFHARAVSDPSLRLRLERAALKLHRLVRTAQAV